MVDLLVECWRGFVVENATTGAVGMLGMPLALAANRHSPLPRNH